MRQLKIIDAKTINKVLSWLSKQWGERRYLEHFGPKSIDEAVFLLDKHVEEAKIIAGGVGLIRLMKNKVIAPKVLVNIKTVPDLAYIREDAEGLKIGTLTTISDIETSAIVRDKYNLLSEAAYSVASPQVRNMSTIVGNLCQDVNCWYYRMPPVTGRTFVCYRKGSTGCHAVSGDNRYHAIFSLDKCYGVCPSDMAQALVALDAEVNIVSSGGERTVPIETFYTPLGNILKPDELITEVRVPAPKAGTRQRFLKFRLRKTIDFAISSVAAAITTEAGKVSQARIVLGGVAPVPYRSFEAEKALNGKEIDETVAEAAAEKTLSKAAPLSMNAYKVSVTRALIKRAIMGQAG